ncbi:acyl-CoA N-acyltransferase [Baffinella frigidus]|nr:acyl-CoA N-acyltransferase [Cryptophyta sp. CCMP2293]
MGSVELRARRALPEDREAIKDLVINNHLALSRDEPEELAAQIEDVSADFPVILDPARFNRSVHFLVETSEGDVAAAAGIFEDAGGVLAPDGGWWLCSVTTREAYRRRGLARRCCELALAEAQARGVKRVRLGTLLEHSEAAWKLYESLGFVETAREVVRETPRRMTLLTYEKLLDSSV